MIGRGLFNTAQLLVMAAQILHLVTPNIMVFTIKSLKLLTSFVDTLPTLPTIATKLSKQTTYSTTQMQVVAVQTLA